MIKIDYSFNDSECCLETKTIINGKKAVYKIGKNKSKERSVIFYTATTNIVDWIGNIREFHEKKDCITASVEGVYRGIKRKLKNIKILDPSISKIGDRVMVTEHLNVNGTFEMIATKKRILDLKQADLNFINIGWTDDKECRYLRIDPYTGESKYIVGNPIK